MDAVQTWAKNRANWQNLGIHVAGASAPDTVNDKVAYQRFNLGACGGGAALLLVTAYLIPSAQIQLLFLATSIAAEGYGRFVGLPNELTPVAHDDDDTPKPVTQVHGWQDRIQWQKLMGGLRGLTLMSSLVSAYMLSSPLLLLAAFPAVVAFEGKALIGNMATRQKDS